MPLAPDIRVRVLGDAPVRDDGTHVLYWMTSFRRTRHNFALEHALARASELGLPLRVLEPLRIGYEHASDRFHVFVIEGMRDQRHAFAGTPVDYFPWIERAEGEGRGLLEALASDAALVVGDDWPCFFVPRMQAAAAARLEVRFEVVDACGIIPLRAPGKAFARAVDFRRWIQKNAEGLLEVWPQTEPLANCSLPPCPPVPATITSRWSPLTAEELEDPGGLVADLRIVHSIGRASDHGGEQEALKRMRIFVADRLERYADGRNDPDDEVASGLSPWLHFGHIASHDVFSEVVTHEDWDPHRLSAERRGGREGFWGMGAGAETFLDQLVTWRELGANGAAWIEDHTSFESLPPWARKTLDEHREDPRENTYDLETFEAAATHDAIWNAAQRQLVRTGRMHNYLRMLWGKKILHWSATPEEALQTMIVLNDRYALDGRDPNSYSGITWVLGRYDRAWGPERPIFGKIRFMSSDNTRRKLRLDSYLARFGS